METPTGRILWTLLESLYKIRPMSSGLIRNIDGSSHGNSLALQLAYGSLRGPEAITVDTNYQDPKGPSTQL